MDKLEEKQLDDLRAMRDTYRQNTYHKVLAEKFGVASLLLHKKPTLLKRILRRK